MLRTQSYILSTVNYFLFLIIYFLEASKKCILAYTCPYTHLPFARTQMPTHQQSRAHARTHAHTHGTHTREGAHTHTITHTRTQPLHQQSRFSCNNGSGGGGAAGGKGNTLRKQRTRGRYPRHTAPFARPSSSGCLPNRLQGHNFEAMVGWGRVTEGAPG